MSIRETLSTILRGEAAADLTPESRAQLEELASQAAIEDQITMVRDECAARLKQPHPSPAVEYLLAEACALHREVERGHQTLLALGEKLAAAKQWEPLAAVAARALALEETHAAARLLVKAHEGLGRDPERIEALEHAWSILPDDLELGLLLAIRYGEAGEGERRREMLAELLPRFAAEGRYAGLEEAALEFVETGYVDGLIRLIESLPVVATAGATRECVQLLEIAFPVIAAAERAGATITPLRSTATTIADKDGPAAAEPLRDSILTALRQGVAKELPDPPQVFQLSGLEDRVKPLLPALERFDAISALPPGRAVHHASFGAGRVTSDDGETVVIDFAHARGHRMPYAAARRTLNAIHEHDLRLLRATQPAELSRLIEKEPAEVIRRALESLGGAGDAQKLKVFLVGSGLVASTDWTSFWRRARAAVEKDRRIDSSRAFEQAYRIGEPSAAADAEAPLPLLGPRKPVRSNLATLRKFLSQHPQAEAALAQRFGRYVAQAVLDPEGERGDRARAGVFFARWFPDRRSEWSDVLNRLWEEGLSISDLSGEDEQLALLEASHAAGVESDAVLSGLDSRFSSVRAAAAALRERLDERGRAMLARTLLHHAARYPAAALRQIEETLAGDPPASERWRAVVATLKLIEERPKPSVADKVLRWLEPGGPFDRLGSEPPTEEVRLQLRVLLLQWRSSDRLLFPALDAAERLGLGEEAEAVRTARQKRSEKLFQGVGQVSEEADLQVMTRATWERLKRELERLERELRTTIPATIQKARELGDLKENAEYHSAKLKQANVSRLVASLQKRLSRARFVDDVEHKDGIVGLGTEVVLESDEDVVTFWILGEEEHHHGERVISFQAPVGRALVGRTIGDEVEIGEGAQRRRYRVVSVERKLPPSESPAPSGPV
jgi:transcription elongation factor GreA